MTEILGANYKLTVMKKAPFVMNLPKKEIGKLIDNSKKVNNVGLITRTS